MTHGPRLLLCRDLLESPAVSGCEEVTPVEYPELKGPSGQSSGREAWLEEALATRPDLLLIDRLDSDCGRPVLVGRQLEIPNRGVLDLLYMEASGALTIVETKLAKNSELRREVLSQVLDYATYLTGITYEELEDTLRSEDQPLAASGNDLAALLWRQSKNTDPSGAAFERWVGKFRQQVEDNLSRRRIRLLIVADRIDPRLRDMMEFLVEGARPDFQLALIEVTPYRLPGRAGLLLAPAVYWSHTPPIPPIQFDPETQWDWDKFLADARIHLEPGQVTVLEQMYRDLCALPLTLWFGKGRAIGQINVRCDRIHPSKSFMSIQSNGRLWVSSRAWYTGTRDADDFRDRLKEELKETLADHVNTPLSTSLSNGDSRSRSGALKPRGS